MSPVVECGRHGATWARGCHDCLVAELVNAKGERDDLQARIATLTGRLAYALGRWGSTTRDGFGRKAVRGVWSRSHQRRRLSSGAAPRRKP